jgi:hypothetical protein
MHLLIHFRWRSRKNEMIRRISLVVFLSIISISGVSAKPLDAATISASKRCNKERQVRNRPESLFVEACLPYFSNSGRKSLIWTNIPEATQPCGGSKMNNYKFLDLTCSKYTNALGDVGWLWIANVPKFKTARAAASHVAKVLSRAGYRGNWDIVDGLAAQIERYSKSGVSVKRFNRNWQGAAYYRVTVKRESMFVYQGGECIPREILRGCVNHHYVSEFLQTSTDIE